MFLNLELSEIGITEVGFSDIPIRDSVGGGGVSNPKAIELEKF